MSNFERSLGNSREEKAYSSPINLEYDHHTNLCYGIAMLSKELAPSILAPDKARSIYERAVSPSTNTTLDLDVIHQNDQLQSLSFNIYGGAQTHNAAYQYSEALGGFVEKLNGSNLQRFADNAYIVHLLSERFPESAELQRLLDRPIESPAVIDRALASFAQENAANIIHSTRYSSQDFRISSLGEEYPPYAADCKTELITTNINNAAMHYQLDIDAPYEIGDVQFRRAVNYKFQHDSLSKHPIASCTSHLMTHDDITQEQSKDYLYMQPDTAYENLLQGLQNLKNDALL